MTRTRNQSKKLRKRDEEVHKLRNEEQQKRFAEVSEDSHLRMTQASDSHSSKCDACRICEGISYKYSRWITIEIKESKRRSNEWDDNHG